MTLSRRAFLGTISAVAGAAVSSRVGVPPVCGPHVDGAHQQGPWLATGGWKAGDRLTPGDVFTIRDYYAVNPITKSRVGLERSFIVTADVTADRAGGAMIPIWPPIVLKGPYQNVEWPIVNGALLRVLSA